MSRMGLTGLLLWCGVAWSQGPLTPELEGVRTTLRDGPGDQTDPHVSADWAVYTEETDGGTEVHSRRLSSGFDTAIPGDGGTDIASDLHGGTVVFTRQTARGSAIFAYNLSGAGPPVELAPSVSSQRRAAVMGGHSVVWQDFGSGPEALEPEIEVYDLLDRSVTRLTRDPLLDKSPSVSPDGHTIVWAKCHQGAAGCDIWRANDSTGGWSTEAMTGVEGEERSPDTDGDWVVYASTRTVDGKPETDIYWQPAAGGPEQRLVLPGEQSNPSIAGRFIAFESRDRSAPVPNWDVLLYDREARALYVLADSLADERINDLASSEDGTFRAAWTAVGKGYDLFAFSFQVPRAEGPCESERRASCAEPRGRPEVASLSLSGAQPTASVPFAAQPGVGLLCVDSGAPDRTRQTLAGITLNHQEEATGTLFGPGRATLEKHVALLATNALAVKLSDEPQGAFRVRVLGPVPGCLPSSRAATLGTGGLRLSGPGSRQVLMGSVAVVMDGVDHVPELDTLRSPVFAAGSCAQGLGLSGLMAALCLVPLWFLRRRQASRARRDTPKTYFQ